MRGTCREGMHRAEVFPANHEGGGNYRRPNRWYRSSICGPCAENLLRYASPGFTSVSRWSVSDLRRVVERAGRTN